MKCIEAKKLVVESDELPAGVEAALSQHLGECQSCRRFQEQVSLTWESLAWYPSLEVSPDFRDKVLSRLNADADVPPGRFRHHWLPQLGWQWMALAASILVAISILLLQSPETERLKLETGRNLDRWDEKFMQDLEQSMDRSSGSYLRDYDSWSDPLPSEPSESEQNGGPKENG